MEMDTWKTRNVTLDTEIDWKFYLHIWKSVGLLDWERKRFIATHTTQKIIQMHFYGFFILHS